MSLSLTAQVREIARLHQLFLRHKGNPAVQSGFSRGIKRLTQVYLNSGGSIEDLGFLTTETVAAPNLAEEKARIAREFRERGGLPTRSPELQEEKTDFKVDIIQLAAKKLADRIERENKLKSHTLPASEISRIVEVGSQGGEQVSTS